MAKIGFVGLGIMGRPMMKNLLKAGHSLVAYTRTAIVLDACVADGAERGASFKDVGAQADVIITMLPDGPQVEQVVLGADGILEGARPGAIIVDMSSINPLVSQKIGRTCASRGVEFLDAPVSGGEPKAIDGTLAIMVGGSEDRFKQIEPILKCMGSSVTLTGPVGAGNTTKLANQIMVACNIAAMGEALTLATRCGLDPEVVVNAIKGGLAGSAVLNAKGPMLIALILLPDVPLLSLDALSSGPTSPDHSTVEDVRYILTKYDLCTKLPPAVAAFFGCSVNPESSGGTLSRQSQAEARRMTAATPLKDEDVAFRDSVYEILLSSRDLVENARAIAEKFGYHVAVDNSCDDWDYADAARYLLSRFHSLRAAHPRLCLLSAGEVTVTLNRTSGAGGRNQQFALACALELANYPGEALTVFSAGTDGIDGNTQNAGSIVDPMTVSRAAFLGYDTERSLAEFNACPLFTALGDTVVTGPTGHNLRDLRVLLAAGS